MRVYTGLDLNIVISWREARVRETGNAWYFQIWKCKSRGDNCFSSIILETSEAFKAHDPRKKCILAARDRLKVYDAFDPDCPVYWPYSDEVPWE